LNNSIVYAVSYDTVGTVNVLLPVGLASDSYHLYLYVQVIDDIGAITVYNIPTPVTVTIDTAYAANLTADLTSANSSALAMLNNSNPASAVNQALAIASVVDATATQVYQKLFP
jgi:hypothetical protein